MCVCVYRAVFFKRLNTSRLVVRCKCPIRCAAVLYHIIIGDQLRQKKVYNYTHHLQFSYPYLPCPVPLENCRKLPPLFTHSRFGWSSRLGWLDQPRSARGAKSAFENKTNPVHASGRIKIPLVSLARGPRVPEIPERRWVSAFETLLCALEHVMIAVSSSTQEEEQVFPFFIVLSGRVNLEDVNSADVVGEKQGRAPPR